MPRGLTRPRARDCACAAVLLLLRQRVLFAASLFVQPLMDVSLRTYARRGTAQLQFLVSRRAALRWYKYELVVLNTALAFDM